LFQAKKGASIFEIANKEKALDLVRSSRISWRWNLVVHNRQSFIFFPSDLDFWIAIPMTQILHQPVTDRILPLIYGTNYMTQAMKQIQSHFLPNDYCLKNLLD
jgi:hypothetical protein